MSRPLIGITCGPRYADGKLFYGSLPAYTESVAMAGGSPVLITPNLDEDALRSIYERLDGVLIAGGGDVDPAYYGMTADGWCAMCIAAATSPRSALPAGPPTTISRCLASAGAARWRTWRWAARFTATSQRNIPATTASITICGASSPVITGRIPSPSPHRRGWRRLLAKPRHGSTVCTIRRCAMSRRSWWRWRTPRMV